MPPKEGRAPHALKKCAVCGSGATHHIDGRDVCSPCFVDDLMNAIAVSERRMPYNGEDKATRYRRILYGAIDHALGK